MARDPYEVVLADLRAKRDEINNLIQSLEAFRPSFSPVGPAPSTAGTTAMSAESASTGAFTGMSINDAVRSALLLNGSAMSTADLAEAIQAGGLVMKSAEPTNTVSAVLHRARQNGSDVVLVGRGKWALAEWVKPPKTVEEAVAKQVIASGRFAEPRSGFPYPDHW